MDLLTEHAKGIQFIQTDVSDASSVDAAFSAPWPIETSNRNAGSDPEITVFHTAANIRFYERHTSLLQNSSKVNVGGTKNIIESCKKIGASVLVYTSSASIQILAPSLFHSPWHNGPKHIAQIIDGDEDDIDAIKVDYDNLSIKEPESTSFDGNDKWWFPRKHNEFFSNYAVSKMMAEKLVRQADKSPIGDKTTKWLRTGAVRPGNGVYGPRGDLICGAYLIRQNNPSWVHNVVQPLVYVENCALAHLCYERQLIDCSPPGGATPSSNPDIGGKSFTIVDPGPPRTYGDIYTQMETLTEGLTTFPKLSPTGMLVLAHLVELYYLSRTALLRMARGGQTSWLHAAISRVMPMPDPASLLKVQPSLHALVMVQLVFPFAPSPSSTASFALGKPDATAAATAALQPKISFPRASLPPEQGGIGYNPIWDTFEGVVRTIEDYYLEGGQKGDAQAGTRLGWWSENEREVGMRANGNGRANDVRTNGWASGVQANGKAGGGVSDRVNGHANGGLKATEYE